MKYSVVIGLEIHAQLLTNSKMFCSCSAKFGSAPNTNICPVCTAQPGSLPVINSKAVEHAVKTAIALNCRINKESVFSRKNYFYPDLPKGYQISQYDQPLAEDGWVEVATKGNDPKRIGIKRAHLEEDAGKNTHNYDDSSVDLNRAGVPLLEIVSEPDIRSPQEAVAYFKKIKAVLECLGTCACNMEEGNLRCDANISLMPEGSKTFGTRAEIKNLNSFRFLEKALNYEIKRQTEILDSGGKIDQETRLFDAVQDTTRSMRKKEQANDYRYFPEPDLMPLVLEQDYIDQVKKMMPELPDAKRQRMSAQYMLCSYDAEILSSDTALALYYEELVAKTDEPKLSSNWMQTEVMRILNERKISIDELNLSSLQLSQLILMIKDGTINQNTAKDVFNEMLNSGKDAKIIVQEKGLSQIQDESAIEKIVEEVITSSPEQIQQYKDGKTNIMGYLVGVVMKKTKGKANPQIVNALLKKKLD